MGKIVSCFCYQVSLLYCTWFKVALSVISLLNSPTMSRIKRMPQAVNSQLFPKINYWWPFYTQYRAWRLKCSLPSMIAFLHSWLTCTCRWDCTRAQERREAFLAQHWSESTKLTSTLFLRTCNFRNESTSVQIRVYVDDVFHAGKDSLQCTASMLSIQLMTHGQADFEM